MSSQQAFEESLCCNPITARLNQYINHITLLVNSPPQILLLASNLDKDFIDVEGASLDDAHELAGFCIGPKLPES